MDTISNGVFSAAAVFDWAAGADRRNRTTRRQKEGMTKIKVSAQVGTPAL